MYSWTEIQDKLIELLFWTRDAGLTPKRPKKNDRYLNPYTRRLAELRYLAEHQKIHSLWIPTEEGVREHLHDLETERTGGMHVATAKGHVGAGPGESEAILSLLNSLRNAA